MIANQYLKCVSGGFRLSVSSIILSNLYNIFYNNNNNNQNNYKEENIEQIYEVQEIKKINNFNKYYIKEKISINIIYYNELLKYKGDISDICTFFQMNINGTFYGCHNFDLFKLVCEKIKKSNKEFILLSSGNSFEKIYNYCLDMKEIKECYIYCLLRNKYIPLLSKYPKLKGIYNIFYDLKESLSSYKINNNKIIKSSNLIYFEDYNKIYIKLHFEIIRKYTLYKLLKSNNYNEYIFLKYVKENYPKFFT